MLKPLRELDVNEASEPNEIPPIVLLNCVLELSRILT